MSNCKQWNLSGKGMAFDPQTGESFQLNDSAYFMLTLVREGRATEEVATEVSKRFGVTYERALTDVFEFLVQLESMSNAA